MRGGCWWFVTACKVRLVSRGMVGGIWGVFIVRQEVLHPRETIVVAGEDVELMSSFDADFVLEHVVCSSIHFRLSFTPSISLFTARFSFQKLQHKPPST